MNFIYYVETILGSGLQLVSAADEARLLIQYELWLYGDPED